MVGHFGYIKCGAGQTLQGVTHVSGPGVIYVPGLYPIPAFPRRLGKGPESFARHGIGSCAKVSMVGEGNTQSRSPLPSQGRGEYTVASKREKLHPTPFRRVLHSCTPPLSPSP